MFNLPLFIYIKSRCGWRNVDRNTPLREIVGRNFVEFNSTEYRKSVYLKAPKYGETVQLSCAFSNYFTRIYVGKFHNITRVHFYLCI